jgi:hypothetical protein
MDSSCYAEYIALHDVSQEVTFLQQLLDGLELPILDATPLYCNNNAARQLMEDQRWHVKIKHFQVNYHSMRHLIALHELKVLHVCSSENVADIFTKALGPTDFACHCAYLGIHSAHII